MSERWRIWPGALAGRSPRSNTWESSLRLLHSTNFLSPRYATLLEDPKAQRFDVRPREFMGCALVNLPIDTTKVCPANRCVAPKARTVRRRAVFCPISGSGANDHEHFHQNPRNASL